MHFSSAKFSPKILLLFSSHGGFLTSQKNNQIKETHYDYTKKTAHDSQIVRAKENIKLSVFVYLHNFS